MKDALYTADSWKRFMANQFFYSILKNDKKLFKIILCMCINTPHTNLSYTEKLQ